MRIKGIHHIGIAVRNLEETVARWTALFGAKSGPIEELPERGVRLSSLHFQGGPAIELASPLDERSPLAKFLEERGEGIHHFTLEVEDLEAALAALKKEGLQFVSDKPQEGAGGSRIAFVHPRSLNGILLELRESPKRRRR